jgi:hypothetical protein
VRQGPVQRDEPRRAARTFFVNVPRYWPKRSGWSFRPRHTRSNSYIVFGASVGTAGARTLAFLAAGAAVEVGAAAAAAGGAGGVLPLPGLPVLGAVTPALLPFGAETQYVQSRQV